MSLKDVEKRKQLVENKRKDKNAKKLAQKKRQINWYFFQVSKTFMQLGPNLIYRTNLSIFSKNTKSSNTSAQNKKHEA